MSIADDERSNEIDAHCAHCGRALANDQEWCLECGAARTRLHKAPDWRVPLAIVGGVIVLAVGGLAFALIKLSSDANSSAASIVPITAATTPAATTSTPATTPTTPATTTATTATTTPAAKTHTTTTAASPNGRFIGWPVGLAGFTVVLFASPNQAAADAAATTASSTVSSVGVLNSSQHPSMTPGMWIVFAGRYTSNVLAQAAAARLVAAGQAKAHAQIVAPPGGN